LLDASLANNAAGWQWVAGSGADASPYFRIFNPIIQGKKFDPNGEYVSRWCPELAQLPNAFIHAPFNAEPEVFTRAASSLERPTLARSSTMIRLANPRLRHMPGLCLRNLSIREHKFVSIICGSSDEEHNALMKLYHTRYTNQLEQARKELRWTT
jgi:hypothetical protein